VGSIGVIAVHIDRSARDAMEGLRYTTVFAGARKNDLNPHEPLAGEAHAALQAEVDRIYGLFASAVARNRGLTVNNVRATEARLFFGEDAVRAGLADEVGAMRDALSALAGVVSGSRLFSSAVTSTALPKTTVKEERMTDTTTTGGGAPPDPVQAAQTEKTKTVAPPIGDSGADTGKEAISTSAEVIDLDKVRAEARGDGYREAAGIAELCTLAGMPERTGEMIAHGLSVEEARKALLALKADGDGDEVRSHVMPGAGTGQAMTLDDNPVVGAAKARAAAAKET
jgi:hypothetical protein